VSAENQIRIVSVDDHPLMREGIAAMIRNQSDRLDRTDAVAIALRRGIIQL
jgi:DNA-binding NarL/FixJ family response regulator